MSNLDLEIKKALNNKIDLDKFMLFTVKIDSNIKIDFRINKNPNNQLTIIATYDQEPERIQHNYKNVTMTYYTWNDGLSEEVTNEITIHYETRRAINKTDELAPIVKEMIREIMDAKNKHMKN
jgi:hypothetical protein